MMESLWIFSGLKHVILEVAVALLPILLFFGVFQVTLLRLSIQQVQRVLTGMALAFVGLVLFLHGVQVGFLPAGATMGELLAQSEYIWLAIPIGFLLGFTATLAEPAVWILGAEVERVSAGYVRNTLIRYTLSLGVGFFVALGMLRIVYGIPLVAIIVPGYILAIGMMRFADVEFVAIAFDSGGVATGPMTVTFVMAIAVGFAKGLEGRDQIIDGFGLIALVALAPILAVLTLGLVLRARHTNGEG